MGWVILSSGLIVPNSKVQRELKISQTHKSYFIEVKNSLAKGGVPLTVVAAALSSRFISMGTIASRTNATAFVTLRHQAEMLKRGRKRMVVCMVDDGWI